MAVFSIRKTGAAITVDTGTVTFLVAIPATNRGVRVQEIFFGGTGTIEGANEFQISASPTGTTPGGAITPSPHNPLSTAAAGFTTATTWATAPAVVAASGNAAVCGSRSGIYRWLAKTNFELIAQNAIASMAVMSYKVVAGTGPIAFSTLIEEL